MKNFFKILSVFLLWTDAVRCETVAAENASADAPVPSSPLRVSVPHSERTKGNFLDAALDFLFVRFFKLYKGLEITYDFFEINTQRDLVFTNFKVKSSRPEATGTVVAQKVVFDFSDFMNTLKSQKSSLSKVELENVSGDLNIAGRVKKNGEKTSGKKLRRARFKAEAVTLKNVTLALWSKDARPDTLAEEVSGKNIRVTISDPLERYAASSLKVEGLKLPSGKIENVMFSSATVDGKEFTDVFSFLKAVKRQ